MKFSWPLPSEISDGWVGPSRGRVPPFHLSSQSLNSRTVLFGYQEDRCRLTPRLLVGINGFSLYVRERHCLKAERFLAMTPDKAEGTALAQGCLQT